MPLAGRLIPALCRDAELLISVAAHDLPRLSVLVWSPNQVFFSWQFMCAPWYFTQLVYDICGSWPPGLSHCAQGRTSLASGFHRKAVSRRLCGMALTPARCRCTGRQERACSQGQTTGLHANRLMLHGRGQLRLHAPRRRWLAVPVDSDSHPRSMTVDGDGDLQCPSPATPAAPGARMSDYPGTGTDAELSVPPAAPARAPAGAGCRFRRSCCAASASRTPAAPGISSRAAVRVRVRVILLLPRPQARAWRRCGPSCRGARPWRRQSLSAGRRSA